MLDGVESYIGKHMEWTEIAKLFPNCYVALDDYYNDGHVTKGTIRYICKNRKEMDMEIKSLVAQGIRPHSIYTTESEELNGLWQL